MSELMLCGRDGNLWVALAEGSAVACYCAETGRQLHKVLNLCSVHEPPSQVGGLCIQKLVVCKCHCISKYPRA